MQHAAPWLYIATAQALDDEMRARINDHQLRRAPGWRTVEAPIALAAAVAQSAAMPLLVDCLTLWLTNLMLAGNDLRAAAAALEDALAARQAPTVLVSNEVGLGIVPATPLGRSFRDVAGWLNQRMAAIAGSVQFMIAGLPLTLK